MINIVMQLLQNYSYKFRFLTITVDNVVFNDLFRTNFSDLLFENNVS